MASGRDGRKYASRLSMRWNTSMMGYEMVKSDQAKRETALEPYPKLSISLMALFRSGWKCEGGSCHPRSMRVIICERRRRGRAVRNGEETRDQERA